jgi:hypothetical protein
MKFALHLRQLALLGLSVSLLAGCASTPTETAEKPAQAAAQNGAIDLSAFKLQTLDASNAFLEIQAPALLAGYSQKLFYKDPQDGALVMSVPSDGGLTQNTHYSRTELRQTGAQADWNLLDPVRHVMRVKTKVVQVAEAKPQVIIGQIHGVEKASEMLKLRWTGFKPGTGYVEARFKTNDKERKEYGIRLAEKLSLGDMLDFTITMEKGVITVAMNGKTATQTYTPEVFGVTNKYYFKAGNYFQYNAQPPVTGIVKLYALSAGVE